MESVSSSEGYRHLRDEELVQRLVYHDLGAFEALYGRYGDLVYSTALRIVRDAHLAEDLAQEIFLRLWRRPESYILHRGGFLTWLLTVTRNRAIDEARSRGRRYRHETAFPEERQREVPAGSEADPASGAELADLQRAVRSALETLPPEQRQVIELAYFGGLSQREIAQRLDQPLGTVKTRIRLGMQRLRAALAGLEGESP